MSNEVIDVQVVPSTSTALARRDSTMLMPAMTMNDAVGRRNALVEFTKTIMEKDRDFGVIPGTGTKPTLLKAGAEKLLSFFGLAIDYTATDAIKNWEAGFFYFEYKAVLSRDGVVIGTGIGSCNTKEKKYRYRNSERKCPSCGKATIIKGKAEYGGGFVCFAKKGGCGAKFSENDQAIAGQACGQVENTEPFDLVNTVQKMAQKRALVAAVLVSCNASEFFIQDVEDMDIIEGYADTAPAPVETPKPSPAQPHPAKQAPTSQPAVDPAPVPITDDESLAFMETWDAAVAARGLNCDAGGQVLVESMKKMGVDDKTITRGHTERLLAALDTGKLDAAIKKRTVAESATTPTHRVITAEAMAKIQAIDTWEQLNAAVGELAGPGVNDVAIGNGLRCAVQNIQRVGRENQISKMKLREWATAIAAGTFDWNTGKVLQKQAA